jgi:DNA adenine methylase
MSLKIAKPFLKWAGGKTQLIPEISKVLPKEIINDSFTYVEPFVGSGAILFWVLNNFPNVQKAVVNDINSDLINAFKIIATDPKQLITILEIFQNEYHQLEESKELKSTYFYAKRELFNSREENNVTQAALFIFLNRTCFNGLYRVNKKNYYNVPMGSYKKPTICDSENILAVSEAIQKVEFICGDYEETIKYSSPNTFFYFDPPYKPISSTSNFNSYSKDDFNDEEQVRLRNFCSRISQIGSKWMLSNSDVNVGNNGSSFFDDLYVNFNISRIKVRRSISANVDKRGQLSELLITNYKHE